MKNDKSPTVAGLSGETKVVLDNTTLFPESQINSAIDKAISRLDDAIKTVNRMSDTCRSCKAGGWLC